MNEVVSAVTAYGRKNQDLMRRVLETCDELERLARYLKGSAKPEQLEEEGRRIVQTRDSIMRVGEAKGFESAVSHIRKVCVPAMNGLDNELERIRDNLVHSGPYKAEARARARAEQPPTTPPDVIPAPPPELGRIRTTRKPAAPRRKKKPAKRKGKRG